MTGFITGVAVVLAAALFVALLVLDPVAAATLLAGAVVGLRGGAHWRVALRAERDGALARLDAYDRAARRIDLDQVGPARPLSRQFDQDAVASVGRID